MILIADSGSTKCDWILVSKEEQLPKFNTMGFNPFFHDQETIVSKLQEKEEIQKHAAQVEKVFFYGAGSSSPERRAHIQAALQIVFPQATIFVNHDLLGAAVATSGEEEGITCILGTGSNSCYFNGKEVHEDVPALGHRLGDEGSGSYFGRKILSGYLYRRLPDYLHNKLKDEYGLTKENIFENVYGEKSENVYLASFMKSLSDFKEETWVKEFIKKGLAEFIDIHVTGYPQYKKVPVHFIGSVAYYFLPILQEVAKDFEFTIGQVIKQPIYNLADFHIKKEKDTNKVQGL